VHHVVFRNDNISAEEIIAKLKQGGIADIEMNPTEPTIEDRFMALMNE
jgi:hypothetical protein